MIYVICAIGIIVVIGVMLCGLSALSAPMPDPPVGSYAKYLTDDERLSVQSHADWELAKDLARSRGWQEGSTRQ